MPNTKRDSKEAQLERRSRFLAALALARMTAADWAEENGITSSHLSQVLTGKRESLSLCEKIDAFANERLAKVAAA